MMNYKVNCSKESHSFASKYNASSLEPLILSDSVYKYMDRKLYRDSCADEQFVIWSLHNNESDYEKQCNTIFNTNSNGSDQNEAYTENHTYSEQCSGSNTWKQLQKLFNFTTDEITSNYGLKKYTFAELSLRNHRSNNNGLSNDYQMEGEYLYPGLNDLIKDFYKICKNDNGQINTDGLNNTYTIKLNCPTSDRKLDRL